MKLLSLILDNFKNAKHSELNLPNGENANIYGCNGAGKTTFADGYSWLLSGKNFKGNADFNLKTNGTSNLDYTVAGAITHNGQQFVLRRTLKEKWRRKSEEETPTLDGNETKYYIDDVPKSKKDYDSFIAQICSEKLLPIFINPDIFLQGTEKSKMEFRRSLLTELYVKDCDDVSIINSSEELKPLRGYMGYLTSVDDYMEKTKAAMRKAKVRLEQELSAAIMATEKAKPLDGCTESDGPLLGRLASKRMKLEATISNANSGESVSLLRKTVADIQVDISEARVAYSKKFSHGNDALESESKELRSTISKLDEEMSRLKRNIGYSQEFLDSSSKEIQQLRIQWAGEDGKEPNNDNTCPVCHQTFPEEMIEKVTAEFNEKKAKKLEQIQDKANSLKDDHFSTEELLKKQKEQLKESEERRAAAQDRLNKLSASFVNPPAFEESVEYRALADKLADSQSQLSSMKNGIEARVISLKQQLSEIQMQIDEVNARLTTKDSIARCDKLIEEYKKEQKELGITLATYEKGLWLAERFQQIKIAKIEESVNKAFKVIRWRLFEPPQLNGVVKPCCEATVANNDGEYIAYNDGLNDGAKVSACIDLLTTLSTAVGVSLPIWIDRAGEYTGTFPDDAQVITLNASRKDKKLRVEVQA